MRRGCATHDRTSQKTAPIRPRCAVSSSDVQTRITFKDPKENAEYRRLQTRVRVLSSAGYFLVFGVLYAVLFGSILLAIAAIPPAAVVLVLVRRYQGRMMELANSDFARWEE